MNNTLNEQSQTIDQIRRILEVFVNSEGKIRPHHIITGPSGSGKSYSVESLCDEMGIQMLEINAAQLTKEGTSGNSLSKALAPLGYMAGKPAVCFVDEFDKLFISGNSNSSLAHEVTEGVQNEFLKILESKTTSVFGDYGKYKDISISNILFVFAGAFNGEEKLSIERLREFGIKTEFLGRVGLVYNLKKLGLESMKKALIASPTLAMYLKLFPALTEDQVVSDVFAEIERVHEHNTLGIRLITTLIHQYFINDGKFDTAEVERTTFHRTMSFTKR